jgi:carbonic anhydrase
VRTIEITYRYVADATNLRKRPADVEEARIRLDEGGHAFATLLENLEKGDGLGRRVIEVDARDLGFGHKQGVLAQRPYAAVLGCSDARVPIELIFNEGPNDLFVVRVAGNTLGNDVLGSLRFAVEHLGDIKLIVILGHSGCGAVSAAVDVFLKPAGYIAMASNHVLRNVLDRLLFVVHATAGKMAVLLGPDVTRSPGYRDALIEASVVNNAALAAHTVEQHLASAGVVGLGAAYGVYVIGTNKVWAPRAGGGSEEGLASPPVDMHGFSAMTETVVRSARIAALLNPTAE